jgi:hypothetical protein
MITNTCLSGGSFFAGPLADSLEPPSEEPPLEAEEPPSELDEPLEPVLELAGVLAAGVLLLVVGVGSDSVAGGSLLEVEEEDSEAVEVGAEEADAGAVTIFTGERVEASVSSTPELATLPSSTPKPRNTSTSSTETGRDGSRRPLDGGAAPAGAASAAGAGAAPGTAPGAAPPVAAPPAGLSAMAPAASVRPRTRRSSSSSCWPRAPTRAPQARQ